jgi:iron complex outermembrane receptor protein
MGFSGGIALACALSGTANAQSVPAEEDSGGDIVVTGTRSAGRAALDSSAPIDVVSADALVDSGYADLGRALSYLEPAINFPRSQTTATAANTRPVTLRGLSPDQTLVLVNGKRRHANAILNTNNTVGRGSAGVDLDGIPENAIERIEVLRDGAAAQYGSDAIAGVVNIILKSNSSGGSASIQGGLTEEGDGENGIVAASIGLPIGDGGHLTISGLGRHQKPTNRAFVDQRFGRVTYRIGDPQATVANLAIDGALPVGAGEIYAFGTLTRKESNNAAGFRVPGFSPLYPNGFLPKIEPKIWDVGATVGFRTSFGSDWNFDISETWGYNDADIRVFDSANASLGLASPTTFDSGGVTYQQFVTDATLAKSLDGFFAGGNIAIGGQYRHENYKIRPSEPNAFFGLGADGFAGFSPRDRTDTSRQAYAGFLDVEVRPIESLFLGGALRYDHYDDFGGELTWRATGRLDIREGFALRGTVGTGFRAPSLQQQRFSAVAGALSAGQLISVGTLPVSDPVAAALGAVPLKPERSRNLTAGVVIAPTSNLSFTADYYHIRIRDRIALSEQLGGVAVRNILTAAGITNFQQVRFFTNAVDTTTKGVEATAHWRPRLGPDTRLDLSVGYGIFQTTLDQLRANPVLPALPLLGAKSILFLTEAQPEDKFTLQAGLTHGRFELRAHVTKFGEYRSIPLTAAQTFSAETVVDASAGYELLDGVRLTAGVQNLFDVRPETINDQVLFIAATGGSFPTGDETPVGSNGRTYYARLSARF